MKFRTVSTLFVIITGTYLYKLFNEPLINICDLEKCPFCYGMDFCTEFQHVALNNTSFLNLFTNYFSVKNVYYGTYINNSVVLKKLAHNSELKNLDLLICKNQNLSGNCVINKVDSFEDYKLKITESVKDTNVKKSTIKNLRICTNEGVNNVLKILESLNTNPKSDFYKNVWTILQVNAEPILIQVLNIFINNKSECILFYNKFRY